MFIENSMLKYLIEVTFTDEKGRLNNVKRKKILFFIYQLGAGGAARTLLNITNHLDQTQFEPVIVTLNYNGSYERYLNDHVKLIKLNTKRLRSAIIPFAKLIRHERPDIVFSTIPNYNVIAILARLLSFTKTKTIVREAAYLGGTFKENTLLIMYGLFYRFANQVIALSNGVKDNLRKRYKVNPNKIHVIYNPVDLQTIHKQMSNGVIDENYRPLIHSQRKIIVTAGRLVKEKDQQTLIRAFAKVNEQIDSELLILGDGELKGELQQLAKNLQVEEHVHFIGFQENPYVYFHHADVFALSSISEGFGHVLVEALATGTLIVSTDCQPGAKEVLRDGEYGMIVEIGNADEMADHIVQTLTLSAEEKSDKIAKGYDRANEFAATNIVKQYEDVFIQAIETKSRSKDRR